MSSYLSYIKSWRGWLPLVKLQARMVAHKTLTTQMAMFYPNL